MHLAASPLDFCHQALSLSAVSNAIVTLEGSQEEEVPHRSKFFNFTANFLRNYSCFWWSFNGTDLILPLSGGLWDDHTYTHIAINSCGGPPGGGQWASANVALHRGSRQDGRWDMLTEMGRHWLSCASNALKQHFPTFFGLCTPTGTSVRLKYPFHR